MTGTGLAAAQASARRRVVLVQAICPHYRVPVFAALANRFDLLVLHGRGDALGSFRNAERIDGFEHRELPTLRLGLRWLHPYLKVSWFPGLRDALVRFSPEVVVSEGLTAFPNALGALRYCRSADVPFVAWDSGRRPGKPMPFIRRVLEPVNRHLLRSADACIAYSSVARASFLSVGVPPERIFVAQNTIDIARLLERRDRMRSDAGRLRALREELGIADRRVILYVGAVETRKRLEDVLAIVGRISAPRDDVALVIVGDGPHLPTLRSLAGPLAKDRVVFAGRVTDGVDRFYGIADVAVLPGPGGLSINQAMAFGVPVVARGGDGTEDDLIEDGVSGYQVETTAEMEARIRQLLDDAPLRSAMGTAAVASIRRFDLANMCDRFEEAVRFALGRRAT